MSACRGGKAANRCPFSWGKGSWVYGAATSGGATRASNSRRCHLSTRLPWQPSLAGFGCSTRSWTGSSSASGWWPSRSSRYIASLCRQVKKCARHSLAAQFNPASNRLTKHAWKTHTEKLSKVFSRTSSCTPLHRVISAPGLPALASPALLTAGRILRQRCGTCQLPRSRLSSCSQAASGQVVELATPRFWLAGRYEDAERRSGIRLKHIRGQRRCAATGAATYSKQFKAGTSAAAVGLQQTQHSVTARQP